MIIFYWNFKVDYDKYPGFYVYQESHFGNAILPVIPRADNAKWKQLNILLLFDLFIAI